MIREKKIVSMFAIVLMSAMVLSACGKINLPTLLVMDPAASNTLSITLPASLGSGTVVSNLVGNVNTTVTIDTTKLISPQGVPGTVVVNSFAAAGTAIMLGTISSGTLCTDIPTGDTAGGVCYLRPLIFQDATFKLTIPTETKSANAVVQKLIPPIPLTLNLDATVKLNLTGLLNLVIKGTGLSIHQVLNLTIPTNIPLLGGAAVVLNATLTSTKTPVTDPKLDECAGTTTATCGDGKVETGETCDTGIAAGQTGACPTSCTPPDACHTSALTGSACTAQCVNTAIVPCCGNGTVDSGETCDTAIAAGQTGACPTSCKAPDACHTSTLTGSACTAKCVVATITPCCGNGIVEAGENCDTAIPAGQTGACPTSCTPPVCNTSALTGSACTAKCVNTPIVPCCGNGIVEAGETCDPPSTCPTSCTAPNKCTTSTLSGSAATCTSKCTNTPIVPCCGNGVVETGETCDTAIPAGQPGACPTSCTPPDACHTAVLQGAGTCLATCVYTPITTCSGTTKDGCCPTGCNACSDSDCSGTCNTCPLATCTGPDLSGTWITRVTTTGTITAPSPVGTLTGATIDVVQRMVISNDLTACTTTAQFEICSLSTTATSPIPFSVTYTPAVLASLSGSASEAGVCYQVGQTVAFPSFTINSGWGGPPPPTTNTCPAPPSTLTYPYPAGTLPTTCSGAIDSDGDGVYGITLPTTIFGALNLDAFAGLTMSISLANMVLTNATTNIGTTSFPTVGYIFGSTAGATGALNVVPDSSAVPVTAIKLTGNVPCATVLTHCTGAACTP